MPHAIAISTACDEAMSPTAARVYRITDAPAVIPVATDGNTREDNADDGSDHPSSGKPWDGNNPNNPLPRANSRISSSPPHNAGMAPATMAITWNKPRRCGLRVSTAAHPSGSPMTSAIARLITIRGKVIPTRSATWDATERPLITDVPKSPCNRSSIQSAYCAG